MIPSARENLLWCGLIGLVVLNPFAIMPPADLLARVERALDK